MKKIKNRKTRVELNTFLEYQMRLIELESVVKTLKELLQFKEGAVCRSKTETNANGFTTFYLSYPVKDPDPSITIGDLKIIAQKKAAQPEKTEIVTRSVKDEAQNAPPVDCSYGTVTCGNIEPKPKRKWTWF